MILLSLFLAPIALGQSQGSGHDAGDVPDPHDLPRHFRSIDGSGNNPFHPEWGRAGRELIRRLSQDYADDVEAPAGSSRPSARAVSNGVVAQEASILSPRRASDFVWQWGQFLDHDITETPVGDPPEDFPILVPAGDPWFDPNGTGTMVIPFVRSFGELHDGARQQVNELTAWIDASNVYGSDEERAHALRTLDGTGRLKTSAGDLLPFNTDGLPNAPTALDPTFFLAGDLRANEQAGLTAMHTLFVREHNYWADRIREKLEQQGHARGHQDAPGGHSERRGRGSSRHSGGTPLPVSGDLIYELARTIVSAEMQAITYREFLPVLLGPDALEAYTGYDATVQPEISNSFATAAYRFGHSMLSPTLRRVVASGATAPEGDLPLRSAFFAPHEIVDHGIDSLLRGLAGQRAQRLDVFVVDDLRNFLFGPPGSGGFDLPSLNIQRGRDHGLPSYTRARVELGLRPPRTFADVTTDRTVAERLRATYDRVEDIDLWVGLLAEPRVPGGLVGETLSKLLVQQFEALRDGDRFFYARHLSEDVRAWIDTQRLSVILRRNTDIGDELQSNVFRVPE